MTKPLFICALIAGSCAGQELRVVKNAPFTATAVTQTVQTLADGNQITRKTTATIARDSDGRSRREQADSGIEFIYDPIAGIAYVVDARSRSVHKFPISSAPEDSAAKLSSPPARSEAMGTREVGGLSSDGTRLTRRIAAGEAGNEKAIEVTSETWYSSELQIVLSSRTLDPRTGEMTYAVTDINRAEPDRALFQIPADYAIQNSSAK